MANTLEINAAVPGPLIESADLKQASGAKPVAGVPQPPGQAIAPPVTTDNAKLSSLGETLTAATQKAVSQSGFRSDLVARLKDAISSNNYRIDIEGLAGIVAGVLGGRGE